MDCSASGVNLLLSSLSTAVASSEFSPVAATELLLPSSLTLPVLLLLLERKRGAATAAGAAAVADNRIEAWGGDAPPSERSTEARIEDEMGKMGSLGR